MEDQVFGAIAGGTILLICIVFLVIRNLISKYRKTWIPEKYFFSNDSAIQQQANRKKRTKYRKVMYKIEATAKQKK